MLSFKFCHAERGRTPESKHPDAAHRAPEASHALLLKRAQTERSEDVRLRGNVVGQLFRSLILKGLFGRPVVFDDSPCSTLASSGTAAATELGYLGYLSL